jgi:hypothetical protein
MLKKLAFVLPASIFAQGSFTVGSASYGSLFQINQQTYQGTSANLLLTLSSQSGPVAVYTFSVASSTSVVNSRNPFSFQTFSTLASTVLSSTSITSSSIYPSNNTLSSFTSLVLPTYTALGFLETQNGFTRLINLYMNSQTGVFSPGASLVIPYQSLGITQLQSAYFSDSSMVYNLLLGPGLNGSYQVCNYRGNRLNFSQNPYTPAPPTAIASWVTTASNGSYITTAYSQKNYGISSVQYTKQTPTQSSSPKQLSDFFEQSVYFLNYQSGPNLLFYADTSTQQGTRLAACTYTSTGDFLPPQYLVQSFNFPTSSTVSYNTDTANNMYLSWNGNSNVYVGIYNTQTSNWQSLLSAPSSLFSTNLPVITTTTDGLFYSQIPTSNSGYPIYGSLLSETTFTFGTVTTINSNSQGSVTLFETKPNLSIATDPINNIVCVYQGVVGGSFGNTYNIYYNVYNQTAGTFNGQLIINSTTTLGTVTTNTPTAISAPVLINTSGQISVIWAATVASTNQIFSANYNQTTMTFGTPSLVATNISQLPSFITSLTSQTAAFWTVYTPPGYSTFSSGLYSLYGSIYSTSSQSFGSPTLISGSFTAIPQVVSSPTATGIVFLGNN